MRRLPVCAAALLLAAGPARAQLPGAFALQACNAVGPLVPGGPAVAIGCLTGQATLSPVSAPPPAGNTVYRLAGTLAFSPAAGFAGQNLRVGSFGTASFSYTAPGVCPFPSRACQVSRPLPAGLGFGANPAVPVPFAVDLPVLDGIDPASVFGLSLGLNLAYDFPGVATPASTQNFGGSFTPVAAVVPEPATLALVAGGGALLGGAARRRRARHSARAAA